MRLYLGGYLDFYHPERQHWLEAEIDRPISLPEVLTQFGIPAGDVHLVVINGQVVAFDEAMVTNTDEVKLYSAVGGG